MKMTMPRAEQLQKLNFKNPATWIATWFGCGLMVPAPGTWGTLGALPFGMILMVAGGFWGLIAGLAFIIPLGFWASKKFEDMIGDHDSSMIVIDEVAGLWIALLAAVGQDKLYILAAFLLFRFFDILKPWPVSFFDKKCKGATGVMLDDLMAGIYAAVVMMGIQYALAR